MSIYNVLYNISLTVILLTNIFNLENILEKRDIFNNMFIISFNSIIYQNSLLFMYKLVNTTGPSELSDLTALSTYYKF